MIKPSSSEVVRVTQMIPAYISTGAGKKSTVQKAAITNSMVQNCDWDADNSLVT
jgi:hypothetical protein